MNPSRDLCNRAEGYQKAPENVAHATYENFELIRQLNTHPEPKVAEYSVWSLWQHPDRSAKDLFLDEEKYALQPSGVRRWIYRLHTKHPDELLKRTNFLQSFYQDTSKEAREGLALGLRDARVRRAQSEVMKWFTNEEDVAISELLYEHMARNSEGEERFEGLVVSKYKEEANDGPFRNRILGAASRASLLNKLRLIDLDESATKLKSEIGEHQPQLFSTGGNTTMVNGHLENLP